jgi:hypothetical protein
METLSDASKFRATAATSDSGAHRLFVEARSPFTRS